MIAGIEPGERPTLHFLHILLPHHPYVYLPDGTTYPGGNVAGVDGKKWVRDDLLPNLAYLRFLMQVGFVDKLVGELVARLKATGEYDSSLIVITADHGQSFRRGMPKRALSALAHDHAADVLQVPMFVKLPGQRQGVRSERPVLTVDILPTLADALGTSLPWNSDGHSMIGPSFPERSIAEIRSVSNPQEALRFPLEDVTRSPGIPWKVQHFGTRTPWKAIKLADENEDLVGTPVSGTAEGGGQAGWELELEQPELFDSVQLDSGLLPVLVRGRIKTESSPAMPVHVAIAVNGVVRATTRTTEWEGNPLYFAAMIPPDALKEGANQIDIFAIEGEGEHRNLVPLSREAQDFYTLVRNANGSEQLVSKSGQAFPIVPGAVLGHVDDLKTSAKFFEIAGWATDVQASPAKALVIVSGERQIAMGTPLGPRPDVEAHFRKIKRSE